MIERYETMKCTKSYCEKIKSKFSKLFDFLSNPFLHHAKANNCNICIIIF